MKRFLLRWVSAAVLFWVCAGLQAANFNVTPVRVELSPARKTMALQVKNPNSEDPVIIQLHVFAWSQQDGEDIYTPTDDIVTTPPIFTIPPGATQVVRLGLRPSIKSQNSPQKGNDAVERSYRLYLTEVPPAPQAAFTGVQIALRISLPIFVAPQANSPTNAPPSPVMQWKAARQKNGDIKLSLKNEGNAHVQVANLSLAPVTNAGQAGAVASPAATLAVSPIATHPGGAYVLPGQTREWLLKPSVNLSILATDKLHLKSYSDAGNVDKDIVLESQ